MDLSGIPYAELRFDKDGKVVSRDEQNAVLTLAAQPEVTDLIVLAHGWNNEMEEARALYRTLADQLLGPGSTGLGIVGVLWPSKRFTDTDLIPGGAAALARNLLNYTTYYTMKQRAGTIGFGGLAPILAKVHTARAGLRLHVIGHSFGGRLVSAAATGGADDPALPLSSMVLLQAAFSHFGFAKDWDPGKDGLFRGCLSGHRVDGPIAVTHTANDRAVGIAYALASRIAGQIAAALGDASDVYGGIGRNGALSTPEALAGELFDVDRAYSFQPGAVHNLLADRFIHSHSDVTGPQVGHVLRSAVTTGIAVS